jgi:holliday junction DNA helicase RuvA
VIGSLSGTLAAIEGETISLETDGGVGYEITVPLGVHGRLPALGAAVRLHTELVIREDAWTLFGFDTPGERLVFRRLLTASGFGPKLALAVLSHLGPDRTVQAIRERNLAALATVSGIGRKKAERLILELRDKFEDLAIESVPPPPRASEGAVRALTGLGYSSALAEDAVRAVLSAGEMDDTSLIVRRALQRLTAGKGGVAS